MIIRQEEMKDHKEVFDLIESAFSNDIHSDHREQYLVERLRNSNAFVPELSLVAELNGQIVGYILLTKIKIVNENWERPSLALAPIAVRQDHQRKGIGEKLILQAHSRAKELGYDSVILLGHENYYPKFGYKMMKHYGIKLPFDVPEENCMLIELTENALRNSTGIVHYPTAFFE